jgi:hypothetical protein
MLSELRAIRKTTVFDVLRNQAVIESARFIEEEEKLQDKTPLFFSGFIDFITYIEDKLIPGDLYEFGVASGGTFIQMSKKFPRHRIVGFDSFKGLPRDWGGTHLKKEEFKSEILKGTHNTEIIVGLVEETLPLFNFGQIAFAHIDVDLYESGKTVFRALRDHLSPGSYLLIDDFHSYPFWRNGLVRAFTEEFDRTEFEYVGFGTREALVRITT